MSQLYKSQFSYTLSFVTRQWQGSAVTSMGGIQLTKHRPRTWLSLSAKADGHSLGQATRIQSPLSPTWVTGRNGNALTISYSKYLMEPSLQKNGLLNKKLLQQYCQIKYLAKTAWMLYKSPILLLGMSKPFTGGCTLYTVQHEKALLKPSCWIQKTNFIPSTRATKIK